MTVDKILGETTMARELLKGASAPLTFCQHCVLRGGMVERTRKPAAPGSTPGTCRFGPDLILGNAVAENENMRKPLQDYGSRI